MGSERLPISSLLNNKQQHNNEKISFLQRMKDSLNTNKRHRNWEDNINKGLEDLLCAGIKCDVLYVVCYRCLIDQKGQNIQRWRTHQANISIILIILSFTSHHFLCISEEEQIQYKVVHTRNIQDNKHLDASNHNPFTSLCSFQSA